MVVSQRSSLRVMAGQQLKCSDPSAQIANIVGGVGLAIRLMLDAAEQADFNRAKEALVQIEDDACCVCID